MKKITILNYVLSTFLFLALIVNINAQENTHWYFGDAAVLDFTSAPPTSPYPSPSAMSTDGGSASVSDALGDLLFYTNGVTVWNKDHAVMPNGSNLGSGDPFGTSVSQSVVIIPDPSNVDQYYIFTNHAVSGVFYSVVDTSIDNGDGSFGDVTIKNTPLLATASEKMTAIINPADNSYWVVVFTVEFADDLMQAGGFNDTFYAYKIHALGINDPVKSTVGGPFSTDDAFNNPGGQMKISPDGTKLALVHNLDGGFDKLFTFDFNASTGGVSGLEGAILPFAEEDDGFGGIIGQYIILNLYGVEFSPDSSLLYFSVSEVTDDYGTLGFGAIFQSDFKNTGQQFQPIQITNGYPSSYKALQVGPDGKIYALTISGDLNYIDSPNSIIVDDGMTTPDKSIVGFVDSFLILGQGMTDSKELPSFVPSAFLGKSTVNLPKKPVLMENPIKQDIKLKFKFIQMYNISLFDMYGNIPTAINGGNPVIYDMKNRKIKKINVENLASGTYYLVINDEAGQTWYNTSVVID
jgi:hypothetical protein